LQSVFGSNLQGEDISSGKYHTSGRV